MRDLALSADQLFHDLACQHRDAKAPPLDVALGLLRGAPEPAVQLRPLRHARRPRRRHPPRPPEGLPARPTACSTRSGSSRRAGACRRSIPAGGGRRILICEDAWHSFTPMLAALGGAQLIIIPSASPARGVVSIRGRPRPAGEPRRAGAGSSQDMAGEHGVYVALAQLVGFEGGKAFPGGSLVATPRGDLLAEGAGVRGGGAADDARLRGDHPGADRSAAAGGPRDAPAAPAGLAARRAAWRATGRRLEAGTAGARRRRREHPSPRLPPRPALAPIAMRARPDRDPLAIDPELTRRWLVEFIRDEVQRRRGFERVVIGLSGGVDSSLVAYLAAEARRRRQRDRCAHAVPDLEPREPGARAARHRRARHSGRDGGHQRRGGRSRRGRAGEAGAGTSRQHHGPNAHDHAVRPQRRASGAAAGHRQQDRAPVRLLHLARGRLAAGQPDRRPVQDAGLGAGPPPGRARTSSSPSPRAPTSSRDRPTRATSASAIRVPTRSSTGSCSGTRRRRSPRWAMRRRRSSW